MWGRRDDASWRHRKLVKIGLEARGFWDALMAFSNETYKDGTLSPEDVVSVGRVYAISKQKALGLVRKMMNSELVEKVDGRLYFHDWETYNDFHSKVRTLREANSKPSLGLCEANARPALGSREIDCNEAELLEDSPPEKVRTPHEACAKPALSLREANSKAALARASSLSQSHTHTQTQEKTTPLKPADAVFAAYLDGRRKRGSKGTQPLLTDKRRKLVAARVREGFELTTLLAAARGIWKSTWHLAENRVSFDLVFRDAEHVERFAALCPPPKPDPEPEGDEDPDRWRTGQPFAGMFHGKTPQEASEALQRAQTPGREQERAEQPTTAPQSVLPLTPDTPIGDHHAN